jgi:MFS transporter, DHA2 family, multidrug resistance protein
VLEPLRGKTLVFLTVSLSLGIFMNVLDISIANVAIPYIAGDLGVSPNQGTWVITSFAVSQAIMLPITGWFAKRVGEVRLFLAATIFFTLTSVLCALSFNFPMLIIARTLQGIAAGPMIPLSQSILLNNYPLSKKALATSIWSTVAVVAPIVGPILGGWITYNYSWPWIFYINLPVGIIAVLTTSFLLRGRESQIVKQRIDTVGLILLIVGVAALQILLDKGNELDWFDSSTIIFLAVLAGVSLIFFIVWELTETHPIVDLSLFSGRNFAIGTLALSLGYLVYFSNIVVFPLWLQTQMGYTATWAGFAIAPIGILPLFLSPIVGANLHRWDPRLVASFGFIIFAAVSFWNGSFATNVGFEQLAIPRLIQGIGISCFFTPLVMILLSGLSPDRTASALGLANFLRILGGSFGTSLSVTLWGRREQLHYSQLTENITQYSSMSQQWLAQLKQAGFSEQAAYAQLQKIINNQAFMLSTNDIFWLSGVLFIGLLIIIWFSRPICSTSDTVPIAD